MKYILIITLLAICLFARASYDSTYVLAVKQKYAIPENVSNGDQIGYWIRTYTWTTGGSTTKAIATNWNNAFSIDGTTGLITISDYTKINGKIVNQDTAINIIIQTSCNVTSAIELDTAEIWIKENAYCVFIDKSYGGAETGTKNQPYNNINDVTLTAGYGYFLKRGVTFNGPSGNTYNKISSAEHPMILAPYGVGYSPTFDYDVAGGGADCIELGDGTSGNRVDYIKIYGIVFRDYQEWAIKLTRYCIGFGLYNAGVYNCDRNKGTTSSIVLMDQTYADSLVDYKLEVINLQIDSTGTNAFKLAASYARVYNVRVGFVNGLSSQGDCLGFRLAGGKYNIAKHIVVEVGSYMDGAAFQFRSRNSTMEDVRIIGGYTGIAFGTPDNLNMPNYGTIRNVLIRGVDTYNLISDMPSSTYNPTHDILIEDCIFDGGTKHIYFDAAKNWIIRRSLFKNSSGTGFEILQTYGNSYFNLNSIYYNVFHSNTGDDISLAYGTNWQMLNNIVDGTINCTGAGTEIARNNYANAFTSISVLSNNIDIDTITVADHFVNYASKNFHLKATAISALNNGYNVSLAQDHDKNNVSDPPDIGAFELLQNRVRKALNRVIYFNIY